MNQRMRLAKWWLAKPLWLAAAAVALATMPLSAAEPGTDSAAKAAETGGHRVWLTFGLDRVPGLGVEVMGNPAWQYVAFLIYVVLAFYVSKLLDWLIQGQLRKWAAKTETKLDDLILELLRGPVKVIAFVTFLHIGLRLFAWPEWTSMFISNGLKIIVACSLTYIAIKFVDLLVGLWQQRTEAAQEGLVDHQLFPIIRKSLKIFVLVVAVLVTSQNLGMNVTGLLASLSIGAWRLAWRRKTRCPTCLARWRSSRTNPSGWGTVFNWTAWTARSR